MTHHISVIHIYGVICAAYLLFGLSPLLFQKQLRMGKRFRKLRFFYILIGACYLALVLAKSAHQQATIAPASIAFIEWQHIGGSTLPDSI